MGVAGGVDEDEVGGDEGAEDEVEVDGCELEAGKECGESDGGEEDSDEEGEAVTMVEVVAGFEVFAGGSVVVEVRASIRRSAA